MYSKKNLGKVNTCTSLTNENSSFETSFGFKKIDVFVEGTGKVHLELNKPKLSVFAGSGLIIL